MTYSPLAIANYFIELAKKKDKFITPMKLQKLVYFAHGWCLALSDEPLIDEKIEAWKYGPVVTSLYHEFKRYGNDGIKEHAVEFKHLEVISNLQILYLLSKMKMLNNYFIRYGKFMVATQGGNFLMLLM
jgi:uncharacterized phage-associated protein